MFVFMFVHTKVARLDHRLPRSILQKRVLRHQHASVAKPPYFLFALSRDPGIPSMALVPSAFPARAPTEDVAMDDDDRSSSSGQSEPEEQLQLQQEEEDAAALESQRLHLESQARLYLAQQTDPIIIPSYSSWFSFNSIHPL